MTNPGNAQANERRVLATVPDPGNGRGNDLGNALSNERRVQATYQATIQVTVPDPGNGD